MAAPLIIMMHPDDNVGVVVPDGGLRAGTVLDDGVSLVDDVPQAHKVALRKITAGSEVRRYDVVIGFAIEDIAAGSWVHERRMSIPTVGNTARLSPNSAIRSGDLRMMRTATPFLSGRPWPTPPAFHSASSPILGSAKSESMAEVNASITDHLPGTRH